MNNPYRPMGIPLRDDSEYGYNNMLSIEAFSTYYHIELENKHRESVRKSRCKGKKINRNAVLALIILCGLFGGHLFYIGKTNKASIRVLIGTIAMCVAVSSFYGALIAIAITGIIESADIIKLISGKLYSSKGVKIV